MKNLILSMVLFVAVMNPIQVMAKEIFITTKQNAQTIVTYMLDERNLKVIDVIPLDNSKDGYVKIIYEK
jgi:hypothetical protein